MKKKEIFGYLQTALMLVMFGIMLVLCGLYIKFAESFGGGTLPNFPESEIELLSKDAETGDESENYLISPYFVAAGGEDFAYAESYGDEHGAEIWQSFVSVLKKCGGETEKVSFENKDDKDEFLSKLYSGKEDYFYVRFANSTEISVLMASLSEKQTSALSGVRFEICDMFLFENANGNAQIYAVSPDGDVLVLYPEGNARFNKEIHLTYNNTETANFEFVRIEKNEEFGKNGYFPVFKHSLTFPKIVKAGFSEVFDVSENSSDALDFISVFGMNSDNVKTYKTADGDMVYVEDTVRLSISDDGVLEYIPGENGTDISRFIGDEGASGGFWQVYGAAQNIAGNINEMLSVCAGRLSIENVIYRDGKCEFYFGYTVKSVPVKDGGDSSLRLTFSGNSLTYAYLNVKPYLFSDMHKTDMPQKSAYVMMKDEISAPVNYFGGEYSLVQQDGSETGTVRWTVRMEGVDG